VVPRNPALLPNPTIRGSPMSAGWDFCLQRSQLERTSRVTVRPGPIARTLTTPSERPVKGASARITPEVAGSFFKVSGFNEPPGVLGPPDLVSPGSASGSASWSAPVASRGRLWVGPGRVADRAPSCSSRRLRARATSRFGLGTLLAMRPQSARPAGWLEASGPRGLRRPGGGRFIAPRARGARPSRRHRLRDRRTQRCTVADSPPRAPWTWAASRSRHADQA